MLKKVYVSDIVNYDKHSTNTNNIKLEMLRTKIQSEANLKSCQSNNYDILYNLGKIKKSK